MGISSAAAELFASSQVIDLHVDSFIWSRVWGYRLDREHGPGLLAARFYSQVDFPRARRVGLNGATWVITTNPFRSRRSRTRALGENLTQLESLLDGFPNDITRVATVSEYEAAVAAGRHAAFVGLQGGNALDLDTLEALEPRRLLRVTLTHLTSSAIGQTSSPLGRTEQGLGPLGPDLVQLLNTKRILVDLAHINRAGFFDALSRHAKDLPPVVTHTGVSAVRPHWRNLDDEQLRAIADRGGTVGIMFHAPFLAKGLWRGRLAAVCAHVTHVMKTVGDDFVSLGSDWDGAITTPKDMPTCLELPRLVHALLQQGVPEDSIRKLLGLNFLRVLCQLRG